MGTEDQGALQNKTKASKTAYQDPKVNPPTIEGKEKLDVSHKGEESNSYPTSKKEGARNLWQN